MCLIDVRVTSDSYADFAQDPLPRTIRRLHRVNLKPPASGPEVEITLDYSDWSESPSKAEEHATLECARAGLHVLTSRQRGWPQPEPASGIWAKTGPLDPSRWQVKQTSKRWVSFAALSFAMAAWRRTDRERMKLKQQVRKLEAEHEEVADVRRLLDATVAEREVLRRYVVHNHDHFEEHHMPFDFPTGTVCLRCQVPLRTVEELREPCQA